MNANFVYAEQGNISVWHSSEQFCLEAIRNDDRWESIVRLQLTTAFISDHLSKHNVQLKFICNVKPLYTLPFFHFKKVFHLCFK
jgi:hypothetical protein